MHSRFCFLAFFVCLFVCFKATKNWINFFSVFRKILTHAERCTLKSLSSDHMYPCLLGSGNFFTLIDFVNNFLI